MPTTVHTLWIGESLSPLELLTLKSFVRHGHAVKIWLYEPLSTPLPEGVEACDANTVLSAEYIFRYQHTNAWGHGKGSLAGFSDIFRYKLLYMHGGWWSDMDITCLRPLDFEDEYVFREHDQFPIVGNLMKCPAGSPFMKQCFDRAVVEVTAENRDWFLPIRILNEEAERAGLLRYIRPDLTNPDLWTVVQRYYERNNAPDPAWVGIHWLNEEWRSRGLDKYTLYKNSLLLHLYRSYGLDEGLKVVPLITWRMLIKIIYRSLYGFAKKYYRKFKGLFK